MSISSKIKGAIRRIETPTTSSPKVTSYTSTTSPIAYKTTTTTTYGNSSFPSTRHITPTTSPTLITPRPITSKSGSKTTSYEYSSSSSSNTTRQIGPIWSPGGLALMPLSAHSPPIHTTTMLGGTGVYTIPGRSMIGGPGHTVVESPLFYHTTTTPVYTPSFPVNATTTTTYTTTTTGTSPLSPLTSTPHIMDRHLGSVSSTRPPYLPSSSNENPLAPYHGVPSGLIQEPKEFEVFQYQPKTLKPRKSRIPTKSEWEMERMKIEREVNDTMKQFPPQEDEMDDSVIMSMAISEATFQKNNPNNSEPLPRPPQHDGTQYVAVLGANDTFNLTQIQESDSYSDGGY